MNASKVKGVLLEYLVRRLLTNCGFHPVYPDNLYTYERRDLFYVNGRGAAHDADVLMEPPVQMPFSYPSRILFECKAYESKTTLPIVRNALGLKYDINEFEVVTKDSLIQRMNNRRSTYAIEHRKRYNYQVGVASAGDFSKPAIEFAANNRIPLLSLAWFLHPLAVAAFQSIDQTYVDSINENIITQICDYLKDRSTDAEQAEIHRAARDYLRNDPKVGSVIAAFNSVMDLLFVGLIESGDLIFLIAEDNNAAGRLLEMQGLTGLKGQIHYSTEIPNLWNLAIAQDFQTRNVAEFSFFVPQMIMDMWKQYSFDKARAAQIKGEFFSRIFVFNRGIRPDLPFFIINIDREWLDQVREQQDDLV